MERGAEPTLTLLAGDARERLRELPDDSVHCCVSSPPYFALRAYGDADKHEIGAESQLEDYIDSLVDVFREVKRVLHPSGVFFLNLGDSWANKTVGVRKGGTLNQSRTAVDDSKIKSESGLKPKNLILVPSRVALALQAGFHRCSGCGLELRSDKWPEWGGELVCLDCERAERGYHVERSEDGWFVRAENIWNKKNGLPASITDRSTYNHEQVYHLTKSARYFYDAEAVREPAASNLSDQKKLLEQKDRIGGKQTRAQDKRLAASKLTRIGQKRGVGDGITRNRRSVWSFAVGQYQGAHFAVMPWQLAEVCVLAGSSEHGVCPDCLAPYERIVEKGEKIDDPDYLNRLGANKAGGYDGQATKDFKSAKAQNASDTKRRILDGLKFRKTVGWQPTCTCHGHFEKVKVPASSPGAADRTVKRYVPDGPQPAPVPSVVLDPFCGAGTTGLVALKSGRSFIGVDLYEKNLEQTRERLAPHLPAPSQIGDQTGHEDVTDDEPLGAEQAA